MTQIEELCLTSPQLIAITQGIADEETKKRALFVFTLLENLLTRQDKVDKRLKTLCMVLDITPA